MNILLIGSGGREHALAWKIAQSARLTKLYALPGNAGISSLAECLSGARMTPSEAAAEAQRLNIDLTMVGPEQPLVEGIVDEFEKRGLAVVGPTAAAAQLEGSKVFAKEFMTRHHIPSASFQVFDSGESARSFLGSAEARFPVVVKADGLAAGKGVVVAATRDEALLAVDAFMVRKTLGEAGNRIVVEECLTGREASFLLFTDGETIAPMVAAQDYKRALDGDEGPNTGGMGSVSFEGLLDEKTRERIVREIAMPTIHALKVGGLRYRGVLYIGLMLTETGPKVLEYNVRFGDPETQVILKRLESDLLDILEATAAGNLPAAMPRWKNEPAVCVVLASQGYPGEYARGKVIHGLDRAGAIPGVDVFHAGTRRDQGGQIVTSGGRVLGVTASASSFDEARRRTYEAVESIEFEGKQYRTDIGMTFQQAMQRWE